MDNLCVAEITAQPKSNGDRIRAMTDEELAAEFLNDICSGLTCHDCCVAWLKQEVSEDAND